MRSASPGSKLGPSITCFVAANVPSRSLWRRIEGADYGGENGHEAESIDDGVGEGARVGARNMHMLTETMRVTRCATTQSALTAYFCGAAIQRNQDVNAAGGPKGWFGGLGSEAIDQFNSTLAMYHAIGQASGTHERLVYRLGIGSEDGKAGYAHVWNVVALPTGHFYWLQSFIGQYSLGTWMNTLAKADERGAVQGMSFKALQAKLALLKTLFKFEQWDAATNHAYLQLFNVDMAAARSKRDAMTKEERISTQRLGSFSWDLACAYPTPDEPLVADPMADLLAGLRGMKEGGRGEDAVAHDEDEVA